MSCGAGNRAAHAVDRIEPRVLLLEKEVKKLKAQIAEILKITKSES